MESKEILRLCMGSVCHQLGIYEVLPQMQRLLIEYQLEDEVELKGAFCLGPCRDGMVIKLKNKFFTNITVSKVIEYLRDYGNQISHLSQDNNGAVLLTKEILEADSIYFLVGQKINEFYQNPLLPKNVSIRKNLVKEIAEILQGMHKEVTVEYC